MPVGQVAWPTREPVELGVELLVGHEFTDRSTSRPDVVNQPGEFSDALAGLIGHVRQLRRRLSLRHVAPLGNRRACRRPA